MYKRTEYRMPNSIDVEIAHKGRYGAPGMERQKRRNPTTEEMQRANERNRIKKIRRKLNMNFGPDDFHVVLTYKKDERCDLETAMKQVRKWLDRIRYHYKKAGAVLKYIATVAIGERGAVHAHIVINGIKETVCLVKKYWKSGRVHLTPLDEEGEYSALAAYIMHQDTGSRKTKYICSRNLKEPRPETKDLKRFDADKIRPRKGWYIDKGSVEKGINPYTGFPHISYTMRRLI